MTGDELSAQYKVNLESYFEYKNRPKDRRNYQKCTVAFSLALPAIIDQFFREWQENLPELTDFQKQQLDQIKAGFFNLLEHPPLVVLSGLILHHV